MDQGLIYVFLDKNKKFGNPVFYVDQMDFESSTKSLLGPYFDQTSSAAGNFFLKKQAKNAFFRFFLENLDQKIAFYRLELLFKISVNRS